MELPEFDDCSNSTNVFRDEFKIHLENFNLSQNYYVQWHGGKGCEHGSALDQMTMTYTSFTGYLR